MYSPVDWLVGVAPLSVAICLSLPVCLSAYLCLGACLCASLSGGMLLMSLSLSGSTYEALPEIDSEFCFEIMIYLSANSVCVKPGDACVPLPCRPTLADSVNFKETHTQCACKAVTVLHRIYSNAAASFLVDISLYQF